MGSGLSVTEGGRTYEDADGTRPLDRCGLSLETIKKWDTSDVVLALEVVSLYAPILKPHVRKFNVDGPMLLEVMFRCSEIISTLLICP